MCVSDLFYVVDSTRESAFIFDRGSMGIMAEFLVRKADLIKVNFTRYELVGTRVVCITFSEF